ncbi:MAG: hypothetical protein IK066_01440 [Kiritimatiellae bacterium]|nr:hypothetical protein [Kiritimatiellia bacterium]
MSLVSGNTCGSVLWSDNKRISPMLPEISAVQKCPRCGKYYLRSRQKAVFGGHSPDQGLLAFPEMKEAFAQLLAEGLDGREERTVRFMLHTAYNDFYHRDRRARRIDPQDRTLFRDNALWLIENVLEDDIIKAEFYREIGEFEKASAALEGVKPGSGFLKTIVDGIRSRLEAGDDAVFLVDG